MLVEDILRTLMQKHCRPDPSRGNRCTNGWIRDDWYSPCSIIPCRSFRKEYSKEIEGHASGSPLDRKPTNTWGRYYKRLPDWAKAKRR